MAERIDIPISVTATNLSGMDALQRRITDLLQKIGILRRDLGTLGQRAEDLAQRQAGRLPPGQQPSVPGQPPLGPRGVPLGWVRLPGGGVGPAVGGFGPPAPGPPPGPPRPGSPAWLQQQGYVVVPPGTPRGQMPGQAPAPLAAPSVPPTWGWGARMAASGAISLAGQMGSVGQIAQGAASGFAFSGGNPMGAVIGGGIATLLVGFQKAGEAMEAWKQRSRGVLQVGQLLDQNFGAITRSVVGLNKEFDVLSQQSLEAMEAMSRATGARPGEQAMRQVTGFATAYGMAPAQAGALAGTLSMLGFGANPLARVAAGARNAFGTGGLPMRMDVLQEEAARIAGIGGTTAVPMDQEYYGRQVGLIAGMGTRYQLPGAASGFAERVAQGLSNTPDALTMMLRHRALDQLMNERRRQGLGTTITIGEGKNAETVDLASWEGRQIAMELAPYSDIIKEQYRRTGQQEAGGNPEVGAVMFRMMNAPGLGATEARRYRRQIADQGGFLARPGRATAETEQAEVDRREAERRAAPEALPGRVDAATQAMMERLGGDFAPKFLEAQLKLVEVEGKVEQAVREQFAKLSQAIESQFPNLGTDMGKLAESMTSLGTQMQQAVQAAREGGFGPLLTPFAGLVPLWGAVQERLSGFAPLPAGSLDPGAGIGGGAVQPQRALGR